MVLNSKTLSTYLLAFSLLSSLPSSSAGNSSPTGQLQLLTDYESATCLDGSAGAYYIAISESESKDWVISLEGGGGKGGRGRRPLLKLMRSSH